MLWFGKSIGQIRTLCEHFTSFKTLKWSQTLAESLKESHFFKKRNSIINTVKNFRTIFITWQFDIKASHLISVKMARSTNKTSLYGNLSYKVLPCLQTGSSMMLLYFMVLCAVTGNQDSQPNALRSKWPYVICREDCPCPPGNRRNNPAKIPSTCSVRKLILDYNCLSNPLVDL